MPNNRRLTLTASGPSADAARTAELLRLEGKLAPAIQLLEQLLQTRRPDSDVDTLRRELSRLATLYHRVGRFGDEVALLERCCEFHQEDGWHMRFNARLFKARALLSRSQREPSPLEQSVDRAMRRVKSARE
jgi:hypothetical protein